MDLLAAVFPESGYEAHRYAQKPFSRCSLWYVSIRFRLVTSFL